jgi:CheY-like chemotaxis protein
MATILVIDDEQAMARVVRDMLAGAGHQVLVAQDGEAGTELLESSRVDLIVTDILMPKRDGLETIRLTRRSSRRIPIIAITGGGRTGELDYLEEALEFGADATLRKPFGRSELLYAVSSLLAGSEVNC